MKKIKINWKSQKGFTLVEILVAVALLSIIGVGLLTALGSASKVLLKADSRETARDLAQAQMEYLQSVPYEEDGSYPIKDENGDELDDIDAEYPGFFSKITADPVTEKPGLQKITVVVQGGDGEFTLEGYKVDW